MAIRPSLGGGMIKRNDRMPTTYDLLLLFMLKAALEKYQENQRWNMSALGRRGADRGEAVDQRFMLQPRGDAGDGGRRAPAMLKSAAAGGTWSVSSGG